MRTVSTIVPRSNSPSAHALVEAGTPLDVVIGLLYAGAVEPDLIVYAAGLSRRERAAHRRAWAERWGRRPSSFKAL
jgi:hypothetical protein